MLLTALLGIFHITLAEAPSVQANSVAVPIQTCSGIPSSSTSTITFGDPSYPYSTDQGPREKGGGATYNVGSGRASKSIMKVVLESVQVTKTVSYPNPDHDPAIHIDPNDPGYEPPTKSRTLRRSKAVYKTVYDKTAILEGSFDNVSVQPASPGPQDTGRNLISDVTRLRASIVSPSTNGGTFNNASLNVGSPSVSWPHTRRVNGATGTRLSDGVDTNTSHTNHYSQGTIEAWSWSAGWRVGLNGTATSTFQNWRSTSNRDYDSSSPGTRTAFTDSLTIRAGKTISGGVSGCSRTLVVAPPTCIARLRWNAPQFTGLLPHRTETFNPNVEHGGGGQAIRVFAVGTDQRTSFTLRNRHNPFRLNPTGNSYSYSRASPYDSGRNPAAGGSGVFLGPNDSAWNGVVSNTIEPANAINFPGKYRVTWTPSWSSNASGSGIGWGGRELSGSVCRYEPPGVPDPEEGPQPHPSSGSVVSSLILNVHVYADPPTCTVGNFLFEVNEPIVPKVTLSNPNRAPMWVDVADSNISRLGFSQTDVSGFAGQAVPAGGDLVIDPTVPSINHSGEFVSTGQSRRIWAMKHGRRSARLSRRSAPGSKIPKRGLSTARPMPAK